MRGRHCGIRGFSMPRPRRAEQEFCLLRLKGLGLHDTKPERGVDTTHTRQPISRRAAAGPPEVAEQLHAAQLRTQFRHETAVGISGECDKAVLGKRGLPATLR